MTFPIIAALAALTGQVEQPESGREATIASALQEAQSFQEGGYLCVSKPADLPAAQAARAAGAPRSLIIELIHFENGRAAGLPECEGNRS